MLHYIIVRQVTKRHTIPATRGFYLWLNNIFNRVDEDRKKIVGAERVAAEWILRCGGGVKLSLSSKYIWDYNALPDWPRKRYQVEAIDAKKTDITDGGLDHLDGLEYLKYLNLNGCNHVCDLRQILPVRKTLLDLDIGNCTEIQDLSPLLQLQTLEKLDITGTQSGDKDAIVQDLRKVLPDCLITD